MLIAPMHVVVHTAHTCKLNSVVNEKRQLTVLCAVSQPALDRTDSTIIADVTLMDASQGKLRKGMLYYMCQNHCSGRKPIQHQN